MTTRRRLPLLARGLLRLAPVPRESRGEVEADLLELFERRRGNRGALHAHWRAYHDIASLWRQPAAGVALPTGSSSTFAWVGDARADLRFAARLFARQPAILLLAILGLSVGLGIATAGFGIINAAALRGDGLVDSARAPGVLKTMAHATSTSWDYAEFLRLREGATRMTLDAVTTSLVRLRTAPGAAETAAVPIAFVSGGFFGATGGRVSMGRPLEPADELRAQAGPAPAVISSYFWSSRLNRDQSVIGRTIQIGQTSAVVVGVAERGFAVPRSPVAWLPITAYGAVYDSARAGNAPGNGIEVFGRLLPDASMAEAEGQLSAVAASLPPGTGADGTGARQLAVRLDTSAGLGRESTADAMTIAMLVSAVIGLVLLLACANVATLLVSTAITREREMAVRAALGASRGRVVRQLVTESLALGAVAALIGLLFAYWAIPVIGAMIDAPASVDLSPDLNVYLFVAVVTLVTGVVAGLAPARHGAGRDLVTPLKGESPQNRVAPRRMRSALVLTQAAVSVMLIVLATLFVRASFRAAALDVGFDPDGLYVVTPGLADGFDREPAALRSFRARALPELQAIPGVTSVTVAEVTPFGGISRTSQTREEPSRVIHFNGTDAAYFETLGLRVLAGRTYTRDEVASNAPVAVISQSVARAFWQDESPLGRLLDDRIAVAGNRPVVIGVVADAIALQLHERNTLAVYEPVGTGPAVDQVAMLIVRMAPGAGGALEEAGQRLRALDPQAEVTIAGVAARLQRQSSQPRMLAMLTGLVGAIAIVLCAIGLYGLTASVVGQRAREMAVRAAIGAGRGDLLRLLMRDSLRPVVLGLLAGAGATLMAGRILDSTIFFGVSPRDPVAFAGAAAVLLSAASVAVLMPARRAAAVDAVSVLKRS